MSTEVFFRGVANLYRDLEKRQAQIERNRSRAARSAANIFRRYVRAEARLIRGRGVAQGLSPTGRQRAPKHLLERDVQLIATMEGWKVRDTAPHAHLVVSGHAAPGRPIMPVASHALSWSEGGVPITVASSPGGRAAPNPFVHRGFLAAAREPLIAARITLFGGPEAPEG